MCVSVCCSSFSWGRGGGGGGGGVQEPADPRPWWAADSSTDQCTTTCPTANSERQQRDAPPSQQITEGFRNFGNLLPGGERGCALRSEVDRRREGRKRLSSRTARLGKVGRLVGLPPTVGPVARKGIRKK